jgi:hypothetical protein
MNGHEQASPFDEELTALNPSPSVNVEEEGVRRDSFGSSVDVVCWVMRSVPAADASRRINTIYAGGSIERVLHNIGRSI